MADEPWYVEYSTEPEGEYGAIPFRPHAESNPENRAGVSLYHHTDYGSEDLQRRIMTGLAILRESPNRVVMVGGDLPGGRQSYYHIAWDEDERVYKMVREGRTERKECGEANSVMNALDEKFPEESFVCALLIYRVNSPFNVDERGWNRVVIGA